MYWIRKANRAMSLYSLALSTTIPGVLATYVRNGESTTFWLPECEDALRSTGPLSVMIKNPTWVTSSPAKGV